ncbi:rod shape-determining protein RodA, partial [Candidatus Parcubacteria bacterium]|nr:rod shape-determining protein RodA [Candidatus Parcubacteria bacterium]
LASITLSVGQAGLLWRQVLWLGVGLTFMVAVSFVDYRVFFTSSRVVLAWYAFILLLLGFLLLFGPTIRGTTSWFKLGGVLSFEPVEAAKLVTILLLAKYFSTRHMELKRVRHVIVSAVYIVLLAGLVFLQPDIGSVFVLIAIWFGMILIAGLRLRQAAATLLVGAVLVAFAWGLVLHDYQRARLVSFVRPAADLQGIGYQARQAIIAVGAGGAFGQGVGHGIQTGYGFLPEATSDFIFAAFAEEWGLVGVTVMLVLFGLVFWRVCRAAEEAPNNFARLYGSGLLVMLLVHVGVNIGVNLGLLPITGLPLPFVSYGGSNLVALFVALGILQGIRVRGTEGLDISLVWRKTIPIPWRSFYKDKN